MPNTTQPVEEGLFVWPSSCDDARLIVSRCEKCGDLSFPRLVRCKNPSCTHELTVEAYLRGTGRLVSYTVVHFPPPPPFVPADPFTPFGIGLVEFPEGIAILGRIQNSPGKIRLNGSARLVLSSLYNKADGTTVMGWAFALEEE